MDTTIRGLDRVIALASYSAEGDTWFRWVRTRNNVIITERDVFEVRKEGSELFPDHLGEKVILLVMKLQEEEILCTLAKNGSYRAIEGGRLPIDQLIEALETGQLQFFLFD